MKIAIDAHNLENEQTGVARYLLNMLNVWRNRNDNHQYILYFQNKIPANEILNSHKFIKKIVKNSLGIKSNALWQHFTFPKALKKNNIDILFSPSYISPLFYKGKLAIVLHDICYEAHPEWFSPVNRFLLKEISKYSAKKANIVFTVSEYSKKEIVKYYKVDKEKIFVIYNAADPHFSNIENQSLLSTVKEKYQIKNKFIFFIGSIFNRRYISELLQAFKKIRNNYPQFQLLLIGKNHTYPFIDIERQVQDINILFKDTAIIQQDFIKNDDDLNLLYNAATATIYLSEYEGYGLPLIESMTCSTPVITNSETSLPEIGQNAVLYVDPKSPRDIAAGIEKIILDQNLVKSLREKGIKRSQDFSWEESAKVTIKIIENIK